MSDLFARQALLPDGWRQNVKITIAEDGTFAAITPDSPAPADAEWADCIVPPMPNLHSHAFQRAMSGLGEKRANPDDTFWTWRKLMYQLAHRITPEQMQAISAYLYAEMLCAGYTQVAEFHYLHNAHDGAAYAGKATLSLCLANAAEEAGIGLTLLPTLYTYGGFGGKPLQDAQKRFASTPELIADIVASTRAATHGSRLVSVGVGLHSLRAVSLEAVPDILRIAGSDTPVHIHIAEQMREVRDCVQATGQRPIEHLLAHAPVDERWCLVHATHLTEAETRALAKTGAIAGLCPITEANLGDGIFPLTDYVGHNGRFGLGSDSNILLSPWEELRILEYSQRLHHQKRCVSLPFGHLGSTGGWLYRESLKGGAQACGLSAWGLQTGARADLCVLDTDAFLLPELMGDDVLDAAIFSQTAPPVLHVMSAGQWRVRDRQHHNAPALRQAFRQAVRPLLSN
ncbi:formimidoylglutamate deiminase [Acetobacter sp.]|jgi:formimidoylglutamate deiminase|uniref:formimidoylglutamate deiminase n=1 Tax=Acetobacter sp. TaxID=440 RepID=UPI0025C4F0FA|nr:formimidoylglutamate deiminase [Acetobacter sp.]MCH4089786.1 formimidoylglutamate deiminase [Acetobacter sp.]MCI1298482.1 formimidoylglutamate deiminase [Acetobacter sp.]